MTGDLDVRRLAPADAPGLGALIVRCYGDAYPKAVMYRAEELAARIRAGAYDGVVATAGPAVVGHIGFSRPAPDATVVEAGTTVVVPERRGEGLMGRMGEALGETLISEQVCGFLHFPTTAHPVMQRASVSAGGRETGVMLAYLPPAEASGDRLAVTVVYQPILPAPAQAVVLPERYAELVLELARALRLERTRTRTRTRTAAPGGAPRPPSRLELTAEPARGLERVTVRRIGPDLAERIERETSAPLVHVDLPLDDPALEDAVESLREAAFAYAAWLPGWAGHDVLRLQRLAAPTRAELAPALVSPEAQQIMRIIRAEIAG